MGGTGTFAAGRAINFLRRARDWGHLVIPAFDDHSHASLAFPASWLLHSRPCPCRRARARQQIDEIPCAHLRTPGLGQTHDPDDTCRCTARGSSSRAVSGVPYRPVTSCPAHDGDGLLLTGNPRARQAADHGRGRARRAGRHEHTAARVRRLSPKRTRGRSCFAWGSQRDSRPRPGPGLAFSSSPRNGLDGSKKLVCSLLTAQALPSELLCDRGPRTWSPQLPGGGGFWLGWPKRASPKVCLHPGPAGATSTRLRGFGNG